MSDIPPQKEAEATTMSDTLPLQGMCKRRKTRRWTKLEEDSLRKGVNQFGEGNWKVILASNQKIFEGRTAVDLKDKWKNLLRRSYKERDMKERDMEERDMKERDMEERDMKERDMEERDMEERDMKEWDMKERDMKEQDMKEQDMKEQDMKEQDMDSSIISSDLELFLFEIDPLSYPITMEVKEAIEDEELEEDEDYEEFVREFGISGPFPSVYPSHNVFNNRELDLQSIAAIIYDMDNSLLHYNQACQRRAYGYRMDDLRRRGFPVNGLTFDSNLVGRGLVVDKAKGNVVKPDKHGYIGRAMHGTRMLSTEAIREIYGREPVDLTDGNRWEFLNTLLSISEAVAYMQMVERFDEGRIRAKLCVFDYKELYKAVGREAHIEDLLKTDIMSKPELFVELDPKLPLALLDLKEAGKKLLLITNSNYHYSDKLMKHSFNRFLPSDRNWQDLFDFVIISARKPEFFRMSLPMYEIVVEELGLMRSCFRAQTGGLYSGGSAQMIEHSLNLHGDEILFMGDHIGIIEAKVNMKWRTAFICPDLEVELHAMCETQDQRASLLKLLSEKRAVEYLSNQLQLDLQRQSNRRPAKKLVNCNDPMETMKKLHCRLQCIEHKIRSMTEAHAELCNNRWGWLLLTGPYKISHWMLEVEKYADVYSSRVSNFLLHTPFSYFGAEKLLEQLK